MPMSQLKVLFSSAGRRVELASCLRAGAKRLGLKVNVLAADLRPELSAACQAAERSFSVPRCTEPDFVHALLEICGREKVSLLVPTIDTELPILAAHAEDFSKLGTRVVVSSPEVVSIARDKLRTADVFAAAGVTVPRTAKLADLLHATSDWRWPVVLKPIGGSSSVGLKIVKTVDEARRASEERDDYLAQEQWFGREYTVNMFFDAGGHLRAAVPHWRIETRGGEVSKGRTERLPVLIDAAHKIAAALPGARGALCFQAIVNERGEAGVFELNARFGGGYPLADRAGAPFAQWLLEEVAGLPSSANDNWREGVTMLRYDAAVFKGASGS